ncbi:Helix-turn-helix domain-containing protein [Paenibacillus sp. UNCCL117]|uniref:helix-turn-helix domain-containing protein n=1 Tax=unclassified Paenibacillus TaxID=185978 RepID=UPI00088F1CC6|nr:MULTISPECIES: helix-turn-helix domain-containing protein [unclassified Paenibacillus]SDE41749.1 Helix-turn-helix domain-containing protein [Paenibacillus sp. cl123]SFW65540.1 Helix-turn-helix domain-containing protein [Paenibacillus sp. UNCCL117]
MYIRQFPPSPMLFPYLDGIWVQEDMNPTNFANRNPVKVLPTSRTVIGIQYGHPMKKLGNNAEVSMGSSGITGLHETVQEYVGTGAIGTIIIPFKPGGLSHFTKYPLHEFQNADVPLELVFPGQSVRELEERLIYASGAAERVGIVQQFLIAALRNKEKDHLVLMAVKQITRSQGSLSIERLAAQCYVSKRTLERKFNALIGASPKQFAGIVRFQHTIQLRHAGYDYLDIVQACGYTDHAHFAKDFKAFAGCSPELFFCSEVQPELKKSFNESEANSGTNHHLYY